MTDIVIPLSKESQSRNLQLVIALRSLEKYATNLGTVHIVTDADLSNTVKNVHIIRKGDPITDLKDANIINKVIAAAEDPSVADRFMFWSDDQCLTAPLDLDKAPIVYNTRDRRHFNISNHKWYARMQHTFDYIEKQTGRKLPFNYDAHCPQPYEKKKVLEIFNSVPYLEQPGFCINTIYFGMQGVPPQCVQERAKVTFEKGNVMPPRKMQTYCGYDDMSWRRGISLFLLGMFFEPCSYEVDQ